MSDWQHNIQPYSTSPVFPEPPRQAWSPNPYATTSVSQFEYGSFLRRLVAVLLDGVILAVISIGVWLFMWVVRSWFEDPSSRLDYLFDLAQPLVSVLYVVIGTSRGGTWGYRGLGLQVTTQSGGIPSLLTAIIREWAQVAGFAIGVVVSILMYVNYIEGDIDNVLTVGLGGAGIATGLSLIWFFGCFLVLFDEHRQALHDKIASTYVIRKRW